MSGGGRTCADWNEQGSRRKAEESTVVLGLQQKRLCLE